MAKAYLYRKNNNCETYSYTYGIEYRLDDVEADQDYTDEVTTKVAVRKQLRELRKKYGVRVVDVIIKKWEYIDDSLNEWVDIWGWQTSKEEGTAIEQALLEF